MNSKLIWFVAGAAFGYFGMGVLLSLVSGLFNRGA